MARQQKSVYFTEEEKNKLLSVATSMGLSFAAFVRSSTIEKANSILNKSGVVA
jgi:hypothetical protein